MRIKNYFIAVFMLLICVFALTACVPYDPMEITVKELPENTDVYMLLKPEAELLKERSDDDIMKGTEIWEYSGDGWVSASLAVQDVRENRSYTDTSEYKLEVGYKKADGSDKIREFCAVFKEMRFAVVDKSGNVERVSQVYSLIPEDKFGYPDKMIYNAKDDTLRITDYCEREFRGCTPTKWWAVIALFSWITDLVIFIIIVVSLVKKRQRFTAGEKAALSVLSIPAIADIILAAVISVSPYLNVSKSFSVRSAVTDIVLFNLPFVIDIIMLAGALADHHSERKKSNKPENAD